MTRTSPHIRAEAEAYRSRVRGSLLGGAIGDALGGFVEFSSLGEIRRAHPNGVRTYTGGPGWPPGTVTDDTQMTMFTAEGLIRASVRQDRGLGFTVPVVHRGYERWLQTQHLSAPPQQPDGWLAGLPWLYARRAPGMTCMSALEASRASGELGRVADNDSKGCGGVMRVAPVGLLPDGFSDDPDWRFDMAAEIAGCTHGHPTGQTASGAMAVLVHELGSGPESSGALDGALTAALTSLARRPGGEETIAALQLARRVAAEGPPSAENVERVGGGWIAEEALAIAVYAALCHPGPDEVLDALSLAVSHSGDSDSTGAICGNLLGAWHGETALPPSLVFGLEGRGDLLQLADDFVMEFTVGSELHGDHGPSTGWNERYPGA